MNQAITLFTHNQEFVVTAISFIVVWLIGLIWKRSADKSQIAAAITMILDIVQDIANSDANKPNAEKKQKAIALVEKALPKKKKSLILKTFGTIGGAIEFVWKSRKTIGKAFTKIKRLF